MKLSSLAWKRAQATSLGEAREKYRGKKRGGRWEEVTRHWLLFIIS